MTAGEGLLPLSKMTNDEIYSADCVQQLSRVCVYIAIYIGFFYALPSDVNASYGIICTGCDDAERNK